MDHTRPKRKRGIETREQIFKISALLFAQKGYDVVSVREIASACGIKESSIYNHFASKGAILTILLDYFAAEVAKARVPLAELGTMMEYMSGEEILRHLIIRMGQREDETLDYVAAIVFTERYRNEQAAKLYFDCVVTEPAAYYTEVFLLMTQKGLLDLPQERAEEIAIQYNNVLIALANEYAMAKNGTADTMEVVKKMMAAAKFFVEES